MKTEAQIRNEVIYLQYEEDISINQYYDSLNNLNIELVFTISNNDALARPTTYIFWVDNISIRGNLKFDELKEEVSKEDYDDIQIITLKDLKKLSSCDLFITLADSKIYLIKVNDDIIYKYSLSYKSTLRGIEYSKN